jgi:hypothetical protein
MVADFVNKHKTYYYSCCGHSGARGYKRLGAPSFTTLPKAKDFTVSNKRKLELFQLLEISMKILKHRQR